MKVLIYVSHIGQMSLLIDEAIELSSNGHDVYFLHNCCMDVCRANFNHNTAECKMCRTQKQKALGLLPKTIKIYDIRNFMTSNDIPYFEYHDVNGIKEIEYKGIKVGYSVMSSYISGTRNLYPKINKQSKIFFDKLITASCRLTDALEEAIKTIHPDRICFWNSRYFDSRPLFDLAKNHKIEAVSIERTNDVGTKNVKRRFINHTPHDILYNDEQHHKVWDNAPCTLEEKYKIGRGFFEKRRTGIAAGDKVYIGKQQKGLLPSDWDKSKRNIVIFNSSEDEFSALGDEFERLALFPTQYRGIKYILDALKDDKNTHVYLRIHPNLANIRYRYHAELIKLSKEYKNLTVIQASDSISTYALMEAAEKVVVFGSTMGLESSYWGKPVILLAAALYYYSDICYVPKSEIELSKLLKTSLTPKDSSEAVKWGFYILYRNPADYTKYIDIDKNWFYVGKHRLLDVHYLKLLGSSKLYAIYSRLLHRYYCKHATWDYDVPIEEDSNAIL